MTIYLWAPLLFLALGAGLYWWGTISLAADTVAHDSHEADGAEDQR